LVNKSQSAFIKGRLLHDNFLFVQSSAKLLHARRIPCLLFKVDLSHAFDSVAWQFLMEVLECMGFPRGWIDWVTALLPSANTRVLLNGSPGDSICHAHGLHQGDPLSPMLFLLVMEALNAMIHKADDWNLLVKLGVHAILYRASMYSGDLILFTKPNEQDL
jgi:hypothetical protein